MIYILLLLLLLNLCVFYRLFNQNLLSPSFLFTLGVFLCTLSILPVKEEWEVSIHVETVLCLYLSSIIFSIGEFIPYLFCSTLKKRTKIYSKPITTVNYKKYLFWGMLFSILFTLIYTIGVLNAARAAGWKSGFSGLLYYIRIALQYRKDIILFRMASWSYNFLAAYSYFMAYLIIFSKKTKKIFIYQLIPILLYAFSEFISAGRLYLIVYFIYIVSLWVLKNYFYVGRNNIRIIKKLLLPFILFCFLFLFIGFLRKNPNSTKKTDIAQTFAIYTGSGIAGYDKFIIGNNVRSNYVGERCLNGLYAILNKLGFDFPVKDTALDFSYFPSGVKTNIYTAFGRLVPDFGYLWTFIIILFMGFFYSMLFYTQKKPGFGIIMYCSMIYAVVMMGIEEEFLVRFLAIKFVVKTILIIFIIYIFRLKNQVKIYRVALK